MELYVKVSVIVPTYKDLVALKLILDSLDKQSYKEFDIIIAEDDDSAKTKEFLNKYKSMHKIYHFTQEDKGNRKAFILNKALKEIKSDYLIFIDGDTIAFKRFVESHVELAQKKYILCGRRVNLGKKISEDIRDDKIQVNEIESSYRSIKTFKYLTKNGTRHYEQGVSFSPNNFILKFFHYFDKNLHILGSNFSCFRDDLEYINGFDEDIEGGSRDDVDLEWRFLMSGCKLKSVKFCANLFHLYHDRSPREESYNIAQKQMKKNKLEKRYICKNGIKKL